ncbi:hypothetical protein K458DRAFT_386568 [Lentithecium fluviatile CBS 122367]|uniref:Uncharacterized protein n=1 Tax=Lentithecium fluviatile CBS 122367 TaxID=1168545 RepID=A0A6G1J7S7_9PLEO|nr:hypothetical protein K458DRAFT_386568 [Lentithecium fluviatile CBS 122367]
MEDLFAQATQHGKSEQQAEEDVVKIFGSPDMVTIVKELQEKQARGASIDELIDSANDIALGKMKQQKRSSGNAAQDCINACVEWKTQQCKFMMNPNLAECSEESVESDCKKSCTKQ